MSVMREDTTKIVLPRSGPDDFWSLVLRRYARRGGVRAKYLAMLALRECADWPLKYIARAFGHRSTHVARCLRTIKRDIRRKFGCESSTRPGGAGMSNAETQTPKK